MPTPVEVTISDILSDLESYESTLISIKGVTISGSSTYSGTTTVADATGSISMFTSSAASFANNALPTMEVDMVAIASQFDDPQVLIRSINDIDDGGGGTGGDLTIKSLREAFESGASSAASGMIEGVVISDYVSGNTTGRNLHIQDASGGITLRFNEAHDFVLGTKLQVDVSGLELSEFSGLLQVNNIPNNNAQSLGIVDQPEPKVITLATLISDLEILESTLVRVNGVTFSGGSTFDGTVTVTDATGSVVHFGRADANFVDSPLPSGEVDIIAIVTQFNDPQVTLRNLEDILN